jgi:hypothetical protein
MTAAVYFVFANLQNPRTNFIEEVAVDRRDDYYQ